MEEKFPNIEIELLEGNYAEVENWLQNGRLDCGFINNDTYFESFEKSFEIVQLKRIDFYVLYLTNPHYVRKTKYQCNK